tara:strand:- start:8414 stop:8860 length:447 start_codon:yes stop_codon:yes gene_type:complete
MGITTALCNTFKQELLQGLHAFGTDTFKLALIKSGESGTYGPATTNYSDVTGNSDEIGDTGSYSAGGSPLANVAVTGGSGASTAFVDFDNVQFTSATIDANGAIIYNSSDSNKAVAIIDFGSTQSSDAGTFTVTMPAPGTGTAIIRIA